MALILCIFPTVALAADHEISASGTYSLSDYTFSAGDTLTIRGGLTVTLSGSAPNISIVCEPNVNLTINGVGITVTGYELSPIAFTGGIANTLTIAGDSSLTAQNNQAALRVEGSTVLTISGGATLHATSFQGAAIGSGIDADSGAITITSGNIDAQCGSNGAGIGGGGGGSNGTVNITGGNVNARGGARGAGIGGGGTDLGNGGSGGTINISGGSVTATGGAGYTGIGGAGIGGGNSDAGIGGSGGTVTISGGYVNATGQSGGAGIGGGNGGTAGGAGGTLSVTNKANVDATGSGGGYDVGSGAGNTAGGSLSIDGYSILRLRANGANSTATVNTGTVTGTSGGTLSGAYYNGSKLQGEVIDWGDPYLAGGTGYTFDGSTVVIGSSGDYVVVGKKSLNYSTITVSAGLTANIAMLNTYMYRDYGYSPLDMQGATVMMTLFGDTEMICNDRPAIWLDAGSDLTIQGGGKLTATSSSATGIGSSVNVVNGKITIKSGTIIAAGGSYSAGIGGDAGGGAIRIEGGNVTATGGSYSVTLGGAGIGGGTWASGGNTTITGGTVTAAGGAGSAGIGGGSTTNTNVGNGGTINISGGIVYAAGGSNGAGIGGGQGGSGGTVNISGSAEVRATGGASAAGIGGGNAGTAGTINLSGGIVYAVGTNSGQDIGYGAGGSGGTVGISGNAAVFLAKDSGLAPTTTTHTHLTYTEDTDDIFGYAIPGAWTPAFGAYLRVNTLTYNANGGTGTAPSSLTKLYQNTINVSGGSSLMRENYTFSGWNTAADGSGTDYSEGDTFAFTADATLFAQWVPVSYTITYNLGGGTVSPANPASYTVESSTFTLRNPGRAGYSFAGWSGTGIAGTSMTVTIPAGSTGNRSFTANWSETLPAFVPVTGITGVPATAEAGVDLTLTGTVAPANATNKTIVWSVQNAGTTGATVSGNTLSTTAAGAVIVKATITNGASESTDYTQDFTITVSAAPLTFVPVTGITGVPAALTAGVNLALTGTVAPANATNKAIVWSVQNAGTTGATVSGNTLSTTEEGVAIVRATITNGASESTDYLQDFTITVSAVPVTTYTVTFYNNGSVYYTKTVNAGESIGSAAWPADPARNSYTFGGWFTGENGAGAQFTSTIPVYATMTVYAKWTYNDGGDVDGDSGSNTPTTPTYYAKVKADNGAEMTLPVTVDRGNGIAAVDTGSLKLTSGRAVITIPSIPGVGAYSVGIPVSSLSVPGGQGTLTLDTDAGSITVSSNMLVGISGISGIKAEITIGKGNKSGLPESVKAAIGDRPLVRITLSVDGIQTGWSNPDAPVTVSIPYTPTADEFANLESIVIWYIDGSGNVVTIPNGFYDPETGMVTFSTTHFSLYATAYNKVSFNDVTTGEWYNKAVSFIAARGIAAGTGNGNYSPDARLTRGEFIVLMMRTCGVAPDKNPTVNFSDAGNTYYTGYLATAKRLGICAGIGNNLYAPGKEITRQEMFTLLYNALKAIGQLPQGNSGNSLSDFSDAGQISSWAKEAMTLLVETGTIGGNNGMLTPTSTASRAETAQVIYNLLAK